MAREPRFPGIEWYCDNCGAHLNEQKHFNDHKYTWVCTECGYKSSISWNNINADDNKATKFLLHLLGFISYVGFETAVMLAIAMFGFGVDKKVYLFPFIIFFGLYLFVSIVSVFVEFLFRHTTFNLKNLLIVLFRNLKEDIIAPFMFLKEPISNILAFITHKLPFKRKYIWHSNKTIVVFSIIYDLITVLEIVALSRIIGFGVADWLMLINKGIESIKHLLP